jgi:hypothetical protein
MPATLAWVLNTSDGAKTRVSFKTDSILDIETFLYLNKSVNKKHHTNARPTFDFKARLAATKP